MVALSFTLVADKHGSEMMEEGAGMMVPGEEGSDMVVEDELPLATDEEEAAMVEEEPVEEPVE